MKKQFKEKIPDYIFKIAEILNKNNFEAYLVGGSVRDIIINKTPDDFDIATNAYPEEIERLFPKSIPTGAKFGTITVIIEDIRGENFDVQVTTYRSEADYFNGRWPSKIKFARTIQEDLSRRDFTINAIALNLNNNKDELVDPFNGVSDIEKRIIRAVNDPLQRLGEDGLRGVRASRLASQLDFEIEEATFEAIKKTNNITKLVSVERFRDELLKMLRKSPKPSKGLNLMKETGVLQIFIPELLEGINIVQPEFHSDDVFTHSILSVDLAEDSIKLPALFHDIGKPRTKNEDEKGIHFYGHDLIGAEMTEAIMRRLKFPNSEIERVVKLVRWHMFYYPSADWRNQKEPKFEKENDRHGWSDGAIRRLIRNVGGEDRIEDLLKLRIADQSSNKKYKFNQEELDAFSERVGEVRANQMALKITDLDISGEDLKKVLNLSAGKIIGEILKYLLELVIDDPLLNTKEKLIEITLKYINEKK